MDDFTTSSLDKALDYFRKILKSDSPTLSSEENILMKLQPEKNVPPSEFMLVSENIAGV